MSGEAREMFATFIPQGDMAKYASGLPRQLRADFTGEMKLLRDKTFQDLLVNYPRRQRVFLVATDSVDTVSSSWLVRGTDGKEYKPEDYLSVFARFVRENPAQVEAIRILLNRPKDWNTTALTELRQKLAAAPQRFTRENLRKAHEIHYRKALIDIISMVKHAANEQEPLYTAGDRVKLAMAKMTTGNPPVTCDTANGSTVHSEKNVICKKPAAKTVQVAMNTDKGSLDAIDVLGTVDINNDIQSQIKVLTDKVAAQGLASCMGCIEQSTLTEAQFQHANGSNWVLCDGRTIVGTKLAQLTGISNAPDLRGEFLRGKNFGHFPDIEEADLGVPEADTVGPHKHNILVVDMSSPNTGGGILWDGGKRFVLGVNPLVQGVSPAAPETRPRNVTVNFYLKIN
jgi:hypothetical protein